MESTKTRHFYVSPVKGRSRATGFSDWVDYDDQGILCSEITTGSTNHQIHGHWSGGGPWFLTRDLTTFSIDPIGRNTSLIQGSVRMGNKLSAGITMSLYTHPSDAAMDALGSTAMSRVLPTNPAFDLSTTLGELRAEGIPNFPTFVTRDSVLRAKNAGDRYLEYEFGWAPLVRSIRDFADVVVRSDDIVRSYQEHANISLKRHYEFPTLQEVGAESMNYGSIPASGGNWTFGGRHLSRQQRKWFEAEFIYYLPTGDSTNDKFRRFGSYARKLYGVRLTPEVLWNLSPWSWAADWFGNVGDVMTNISNIGVDGMVMRHAFMMCHTSRTIIENGKHAITGTTCTRTNVLETKSRRIGTPYGFGLSYSGLSTKQKAIVAALGISRW